MPGIDKHPIGIFDSGLGGLTVMSAVMKLLPNENLVYFGDTAHVPYGSKSREVVTGFSMDIADFLLAKGVKMIVVACNTASAFALPALQKKYDIPVIGVIEPGARAALEATRSGRIGVIGTEGTVRSESYPRAIRRAAGRTGVYSQACPLFVPLVEEGWLDRGVTYEVAATYLKPLAGKKIDTLVLGCTHYPLLKRVIAKTAGKGISLIDSAEATAADVAAMLKQRSLLNTGARRGKHSFYVSDAPRKFADIGRRFLGCPIAPVVKVSLDKGTL